MALTPSQSAAEALAQVAEPFVLTWSEIPGDPLVHVSGLQLRALAIMQGDDGIAVSELARALDTLPSSVTRLCDRLVAAGLIDRRPDPVNRRFHTLSLTPEGRRLLERLHHLRISALHAVLSAMSATDRRDLQSGLTAFAQARARG